MHTTLAIEQHINQGATPLIHTKKKKEKKKPIFHSKTGGYNPNPGALHQLARHQQTIIFRLRTCHCRLNSHLKRISVKTSAQCPCGDMDQTPEHYLQSCSPSKAADVAHLCALQNQALRVCRGFVPDVQVCSTHGREDLVNATITSNAEEEERQHISATWHARTTQLFVWQSWNHNSLYFIYWLKPVVDKGGERNQKTLKRPLPLVSQKKTHAKAQLQTPVETQTHTPTLMSRCANSCTMYASWIFNGYSQGLLKSITTMTNISLMIRGLNPDVTAKNFVLFMLQTC